MHFSDKMKIRDNYKAINTYKIAICVKKMKMRTEMTNIGQVKAVVEIDFHYIDHSNNKSHKNSDSGG